MLLQEFGNNGKQNKHHKRKTHFLETRCLILQCPKATKNLNEADYPKHHSVFVPYMGEIQTTVSMNEPSDVSAGCEKR